MSGSNMLTKKVVLEVAMLLASQVAAYYTLRWVLDSMGPTAERKSAKAKSGDILKRLGHKNLQLNEYEEAIAAEVIHPDDIDVRFTDIGGLDSIVSSLRESVIYPLVYPSLFRSSSSLLSAPKGVLLYGPPGCGKTMLARALAKESGATFINIAVSALTNKWYGESNKLIAGLFGLARKVQPSIIFIDEIDSFLRERSRGDHEVTAMMKAEFMTLWDGLLSGSDRILVLGATNRPMDIDQAILRRMPKRYPVGLPDKQQRRKILDLMLKDTELSKDFSMDKLADRTEGLSGSDIKEICRDAAMIPVREFLKKAGGDREVLERSHEENFTYRPLVLSDFSGEADGSSTPIPELSDKTRADESLELPDLD
ncbi:AAA-domain-containing protein [Phellopilus nigrolimitatus]|nr:AAA-domain-containing protein [Phellopilus nigrolimitatus]